MVNDEGKIKAFKGALDEFLKEIEEIKREHTEAIRSVLREIDEVKLKNLRRQLDT
jgi:hypothetical protein